MKYRIRTIRQAKGWNIERLAEEVGTSKGYISDIETGNRNASIVMLREIAAALGVKEQDLFEAESPEDELLLQLIHDFVRLGPDDKLAVVRHARGLAPNETERPDERE